VHAPLVVAPGSRPGAGGGGPDLTGEMDPPFQSCYPDKWYRRWVGLAGYHFSQSYFADGVYGVISH
jgi:hypothetical protein